MESITNNVPIEASSMSTQVNVGGEQIVKKPKRVGKLLLVLTLLLLACATLFYFLFYKKDSVLETETEYISLEQPEGEIYLTLSPLGEAKPNIYKLDLETGKLEEYFPNSKNLNFMINFTSDLELMMFNRGYEDGLSQLLAYKKGEDTDAIEITAKDVAFLRNPVFSEAGDLIAFWFNDKGSGVSSSPEDHSIVVLFFNSSGELQQEKIGQGVYPTFSKDGVYLLYLKNDGLYTFNSETKEESLVIEIDTDFMHEDHAERLLSKGAVEPSPRWASIRFAYCPKSDRLLLTSTYSSEIQIFQITSWEEFSYEIMLGAEETGIFGPNWPVFSPDGNHFVLQHFGFHDVGDLGQVDSLSYISIFDLRTFLSEKEKKNEGEVILKDFVVFSNPLTYEKSLSDGSYQQVPYDSDYIWITDWIEKI